MLEDIKVACEKGIIRISWAWADRNVKSVRIYYKKSEVKEGIGTPFRKEEVVAIPGMKKGNVERNMASEWGLYTFAFVCRMKDGSVGETVVERDVMLGECVHVPWEFQSEKGNLMITFRNFTEEIPSGIVCLKNGEDRYCLDHEINRDTILVFLLKEDTKKIRIYARVPYDKVYRFDKK